MNPAENHGPLPAEGPQEGSPLLSVIIVSFNTRDLLAGCLMSLRRVSDEADAEIIVVDNASSDGTPAMLKERFPEVTLIESDRNLGFAAANNRGAVLATGKFLFFLNPDTLIPRGTLVQLVSLMQSAEGSSASAISGLTSPDSGLRSRVAVLGPSLIYPDGTPQLSVLQFPNLWREFWNFIPEIKNVLVSIKRRLNACIPFPTRKFPSALEGVRVGAVSGAAMMVRADAMREVGGFDEGFFLYHEERDLCYRLAAAGWEIWAVPTATVIHFDAQSSGYQTNKFPREPILSCRILGMDRLYHKHRPGWQHKIWRLRSRNMLRLRAWWRRMKGDREGAEELRRLIEKLGDRAQAER